MKRIFVALVAMGVVLMAGAAAQASVCYTKKEAEAEQGIRIHSELMVIGLNCQHLTAPGQKNLYMQYREFTNTHADLFAGYETALINYFRRAGDRNPEASINTLRTRFANKISHDAATMRPDVFCATYAPRIPKAAKMTKADLHRWAGTFFASHPVSKPVCASAGK